MKQKLCPMWCHWCFLTVSYTTTSSKNRLTSPLLWGEGLLEKMPWKEFKDSFFSFWFFHFLCKKQSKNKTTASCAFAVGLMKKPKLQQAVLWKNQNYSKWIPKAIKIKNYNFYSKRCCCSSFMIACGKEWTFSRSEIKLWRRSRILRCRTPNCKQKSRPSRLARKNSRPTQKSTSRRRSMENRKQIYRNYRIKTKFKVVLVLVVN